MDYNESPIEPLTQHPPSEVGWDYQRPVSKEDDINSPNAMDITKTPKRGALLSKKRNSNSPLLYKPLKKKLIQEEQQESMAGFMKELRAMEMRAKEIKDKKGEKSETLPKTEDNTESQLVVEMDSQPSDDSDIKLQVSVNAEESFHQGKITTAMKNYTALLDDSIEDIMVMCSQEVEAKEFGDQRNQPVVETKNQPIADASKEKMPLKPSPNSSLEKMFKNLAKENVQPLNNTDKFISDTSSKNSSTSKGDSASLEIPDDSFDDFFVEIDDIDFCKNVNSEIQIGSGANKSSAKSMSTINSTVPSSNTATSQNNNLQSKASTYTVQTKNMALATYNCISDSQASSASVQTKVVNTKANFGYLNKESYAMRNTNSSDLYSQSQSSKTTSNDARLFKSKSYSDSNFQQRNSVTNFGNTRSTSNLGISANQQKGQSMTSIYPNSKSSYCTGLSAGSKGVRRIQSSSSLGNPNTYNNISQRSSVNSSSRSQFTPAEIERKRQEAIMKREAKMKTKSNNPTLSRPTQNSIRR